MKNFKQKKLYTLVFDEIKKYIVDNELVPGDKLPCEFELCERMGVSRNVLRESLKALQLMGIIDSIPGCGNVIQKFTMDYVFESMFYYLVPNNEKLISELREIRRVLEIMFFDQAYMSLTSEDINILESCIMKMEENLLKGVRQYEEDFMFHKTMFAKIGNETLLSLLNVTFVVSRDLNKVFLYRRDPQSSYENHKAIFMAIKSNNYKEAMKQMMNHFNWDEVMEPSTSIKPKFSS